MDIIHIILCLLVLSQVIAQLITLVLLYKIYYIFDRFRFPWEEIKAITNAWKTTIPPSDFSSNKDITPTTGAKAASTVKELPPEAIAPSLKRMQRTSGFGSGISDKNSDT